MKKKNHYLITVKYLGFRYHGWAKQPSHKTIQGEIEKNIRYVLGHDLFSTLGASRTDSMVSAEANVFSLYIDDSLENDFLQILNKALPQDIKTTNIISVSPLFNIIKQSKSKEYQYNFSVSKDFNPMEAHLCTSIKDELDIELIKTGLQLFKGELSFHNFCYKPKENTTFIRAINHVELIKLSNCNYTMRICGTGFLRHQIRIIAGTLFNLGRGEISLSDIINALQTDSPKTEIGFVAPASGLILKHIEFEGIKNII